MKPEQLSDRSVEKRGSNLEGRRIEFIVTGGIAGIESPKFIRELRRYGADVHVWMTKSATKFVQPLVFEWASANDVVTELSGKAEHISQADAVIVAPCSLDFMAKMALGIADDHCLTLIQSALTRKPVLVQPSMHQALKESPSFEKHYYELSGTPQFHFIEPKYEESKLKASSPEDFVARCSHWINQELSEGGESAMVLLGPTRSQIDDVRYISNYSTGALGIEVADDLFRSGIKVSCVAGPTQKQVPSYLDSKSVSSIKELVGACSELVQQKKFDFIYFAAAVLDYEVSNTSEGKISSEKEIVLKLKPTEKVIQDLGLDVPVRVGFKLESKLEIDEFKSRVRAWSKKNQCQLILANRFEDLSESGEHKAYLYDTSTDSFKEISGKRKIAQALVKRSLELRRTRPAASMPNLKNVSTIDAS